MIVSFGMSWPMSLVKSYKARTTKGKSLFFLYMIFCGYLCGITAKLVANNITYVFAFYVLNTIMVGTDICIYYRNKKIDKARQTQES